MRSLRSIRNSFLFTSIHKWQIKTVLITSALIIFFLVIIYTLSIVEELIEREKRSIDFYSEIYKRYSDPMSQSSDELFFLIEHISPTISVPMILTDANDIPSEPYTLNTRNIELDSNMSFEKQKEYLSNLVKSMGSNYDPIVIEDKEGNIVGKFYYSNSSLIDKLKFYPILEILIIAIFVFIGYIAFSNIRRNEESKVWVGMAKEAAHQLGTPLSSMMAWLEIIKLNKDMPEQIEEVSNEMEKDIDRLNIIARRFSKIGSLPEIKSIEITEIIERVCQYFEKRLPHLGKKTTIIRNLQKNIWADINVELFEWVIENLLKNAAEAVEHEHGIVEVALFSQPNKRIIISLKDNGKGMSNRQKRQVFFPGYTTKKRGWGLGLSLCKRIVEEYHQGKIYIKDTVVNKGTTFIVEIPCNKTCN